LRAVGVIRESEFARRDAGNLNIKWMSFVKIGGSWFSA